jgi:hypothetical protein
MGLALLLAACGPSTSEPQKNELRQTPAMPPAPAWATDSVTLYLPDTVIEDRISAQALGAYIRELQAAALEVFTTSPAPSGKSGALVVMVKPGRVARSWIVTGDAIEPAFRTKIDTAMAAVIPPEVVGGPVVFGLLFSAWGGGMPPNGMPMPIPESWDGLSALGPRVMDDRFYEDVWNLP